MSLLTDKQNYLRQFQAFHLIRERAFYKPIYSAIRAQIETFKINRDTIHISSAGMANELYKLYSDAATIQAHRQLLFIGKTTKDRRPIGFNKFIQDLMDKYFASMILNTADKITQTTINRIKEILMDATSKGMSFDDIVALLESDILNKIRARLIARTEITTAANMAAALAAESTDLVLIKEWLATIDFRTRGTRPKDMFDHISMNGVQIDQKELFVVSGESMNFPGDRKHGATAGNICNCRCTHVHVPKKL